MSVLIRSQAELDDWANERAHWDDDDDDVSLGSSKDSYDDDIRYRQDRYHDLMLAELLHDRRRILKMSNFNDGIFNCNFFFEENIIVDFFNNLSYIPMNGDLLNSRFEDFDFVLHDFFNSCQ
jgi:hypothetical protein